MCIIEGKCGTFRGVAWGEGGELFLFFCSSLFSFFPFFFFSETIDLGCGWTLIDGVGLSFFLFDFFFCMTPVTFAALESSTGNVNGKSKH